MRTIVRTRGLRVVVVTALVTAGVLLAAAPAQASERLRSYETTYAIPR